MKKWPLVLLLVLFLSSTQVMFANQEDPFLVTLNNEHRVTVLEHGADSFIARLELIERAKSSIVLEYFIYNNDRAGRLLTQALLKKAREGVKVRMLLDSFSTESEITPHIVKLLNDSGIEIKFYNPTPMIRVRKYMVRNHRKLLQIDGEAAILGGRNIGDEYFDMNETYSFIDRDILVNGPITETIARSFEAYWQHDFSESAESHTRHYILKRKQRKDEKARQAALDFITTSEQDREALKRLRVQAAQWSPKRISGACKKVTFGTSKPGWGEESDSGEHLGSFLNKIMAEAHQNGGSNSRILMDSAYFIVDPKIRKIFKDLNEAGTSVQVMTNSIFSHDVAVMTPATNISIHRMSKRGITFWYFDGQRPAGYNIDDHFNTKKWASHTKSMIINNDTFMIGSYNFDPRAHHLNGELAIICQDSPELTTKLESYFNAKLKVSNRVSNLEEYRAHRFKGVEVMDKLKYFLAWPFSQMIRRLL